MKIDRLPNKMYDNESGVIYLDIPSHVDIGVPLIRKFLHPYLVIFFMK